MGSMNVVMRSPGFEGGLPNNSEIAGIRPAGHPDAGLEALKVPEKRQMTTLANHGDHTPAQSLAPENATTNVPPRQALTSASLSPSPKPEYFTEKDQANSPLVKLLEEMGDKFSKGETAAFVARAVLAGPLALARVGSGIAELAGAAVAVIAVPSLPIMFWSGLSVGQMIGICAGGFAIARVGAVGGYLTETCSHNVRRLFGDTKATWEQSLPEGKYPWRDPSSFM